MAKKPFALLLLTVIILNLFSAAVAAELKRGSRGEDVLLLKNRLYELGYFSINSFSDEYNILPIKITGPVDLFYINRTWHLLCLDYSSPCRLIGGRILMCRKQFKEYRREYDNNIEKDKGQRYSYIYSKSN